MSVVEKKRIARMDQLWTLSMHPNLVCTFFSFVARPFVDRTNVNHLCRLSVHYTPRDGRSFPRNGNVRTIYSIPWVAIWCDIIANKQKKVYWWQPAAVEDGRAMLRAKKKKPYNSFVPYTVAIHKNLNDLR